MTCAIQMIHLFFVLLLLSFSTGEFFEGFVQQNRIGFAFLAKFCYDVNHNEHNGLTFVGNLAITLRSPVKIDGMVFMLFDDQDHSWPSIYDNPDLSCTDVVKRSRNYVSEPVETGVKPKWHVKWSEHPEGGYEWSESTPMVQNVRPRWWYTAIGSCNSSFYDIEYDVHMVQLQGSAWEAEFGVNEQGLNTLYLVFFLYYVIFIIIHSIGTYRLHKQIGYTHPLVRLFFIIVLIQFFSLTSFMLHYCIFSSNGWGVPALQQFGEFSEIIVRVLFLMLLMLLAKGWTINNNKLSGRKLILILASLFLFAEIGIVFWKYEVQDPAATNIPVGLAVMLGLMTFTWVVWCVWFAYTVFQSHAAAKHAHKKKLFILLALIFVPWFFGLPFLTVLQFVLNPWVREKVVAIFNILISTIGYSFLAYLLWPTRAGDYFTITTPDHMTTGLASYDKL